MSMNIQISLYIVILVAVFVQREMHEAHHFLGDTNAGTININSALCSINDNNKFKTTALSSCKYYEHAFSFIHNTCDVC